MKDNIVIRQATENDAPFLAKAIIIAGRAHVKRGIWEVILGGSEQECQSFLELLTVTSMPHLFHYTCYLVAEVDGQMAGIVGGYDAKTHGQDRMQQAMPEVFKRMGVTSTAPSLSEQASNVLSCIPGPAENAWIIDSVATLSEYRRMGISQTLLSSILETGKVKGFGKAQINMYIGNKPAQTLYEKVGFKVVSEKNCLDFESEIGSPGMLCLMRDI